LGIDSWEDNIKTDLTRNKMRGMDWIHLAQDMDHQRALANPILNLWVPKNVEKFLTS
jgi:hypothetical protein